MEHQHTVSPGGTRSRSDFCPLLEETKRCTFFSPVTDLKGLQNKTSRKNLHILILTNFPPKF